MIPNYVILVNGPPGAGKDTVAGIISKYRDNYSNFKRHGFADHLKEATHAAYGYPNLPFNFFEATKDKPSEIFFGLTPRQAYIKHSENYMKIVHGNTIFGELFLRRIENIYKNKLIPNLVMSDAGFAYEYLPAAKKWSKTKFYLIRIHREGYDYKNDSRSYLYHSLGLSGEWTISNNGTIADLIKTVNDLMLKLGFAYSPATTLQDNPIGYIDDGKREAWEYKIGDLEGIFIPPGADFTMRLAVEKTYEEITGKKPQAIFSGWGAEFTDNQKRVIKG